MFLLVLQLSSSILDPHGPFQMLNALRVLEPQATHNVIVSFGPNAPKEVGELLLNVHVFIKYRFKLINDLGVSVLFIPKWCQIKIFVCYRNN